jgi:outer membrane lipoprotein-sorting protein
MSDSVRFAAMVLISAGWLGLDGGAHAERLDAEQILQKADEVRNPQLDYTVLVSVTSVKPKGKTKTASYEVWVKGRENTLVRTLSPPAEKGRVLLMKGTELWAFLPTVSKPLRISLRERLIGEVANGDLARANFSGDYTPVLLRNETRDGVECVVLDLTAKTRDVTYARVVLWVEADQCHPVWAEFYAVSGRLSFSKTDIVPSKSCCSH